MNQTGMETNTIQSFDFRNQMDEEQELENSEVTRLSEDLQRWAPLFFYCTLAALTCFILFFTWPAVADTARLPGEDVSSKMESAGTLLRFIDTGIFKWTARILAGLCIFGAGWNLKEMRFGPAVISMVAAILFGTAPTWVKNIFSIGGADSVFSMSLPHNGQAFEKVAASNAPEPIPHA